MKKLLLSVILFASAIVKADVSFETIYKNGNDEAATHRVILSESPSQITFELNGRIFKVMITKMARNEEGVLVTAFDVFIVQNDGDVLIAQPEINGSSATLSLSNGEELITFVINEVEVQEEIATIETNDQV